MELGVIDAVRIRSPMPQTIRHPLEGRHIDSPPRFSPDRASNAAHAKKKLDESPDRAPVNLPALKELVLAESPKASLGGRNAVRRGDVAVKYDYDEWWLQWCSSAALHVFRRRQIWHIETSFIGPHES